MKKIVYLLAIAAASLAASCSDKHSSNGEGSGQIAFSCTVDHEITDRSRATVDFTPNIDQFWLELSGVSGDFSWASINDFDEEEYYRYGDYTAKVGYGDPTIEGFDSPCYEGEKSFYVDARKINRVEIEAQISNSLVIVKTTPRFDEFYSDATFTVTTENGFSADYGFCSTVGVEPTEKPIFMIPETWFTIDGEAFRQAATGTSAPQGVTFEQQKVESAVARTQYCYTFDATNTGAATVTITINDELVETIAVDVELNDNAIPNA